MPVLTIQQPVGVQAGDALSAAVLNDKFVNEYDAIVTRFHELEQNFSLWDVTSVIPSADYDGKSLDLVPGVSRIDSSGANTNQEDVVLYLTLPGTYLIYDLQATSTSRFFVNTTGTVNKELAINLPQQLYTPPDFAGAVLGNLFRISRKPTLLVKLANGDVLCRNGYYFESALRSLETQAAELAALNQNYSSGTYSLLLNQVSSIATADTTARDIRVDLVLTQAAAARRNFMLEAINDSYVTGAAPVLLTPQVVTTTTASPTVSIDVEHIDDMLDVVIIVTDETVKTLNISFVPPSTFYRPIQDIYRTFLAKVSVVSPRALVFTVDISQVSSITETLHASYGEPIFIFKDGSEAAILRTE